MKITVDIEFCEFSKRKISIYTIDRMQEIDLRVSKDPPPYDNYFEIAKWKNDKEKQQKLIEVISKEIAMAFSTALDDA